MSINTIISNYLSAKQAETDARKQAEGLKALILDHAKGADHFTTDDYTVIIKTTASVRLDTAALYRDFPDVKTAYGKATTSTTINAVVNAAGAEKASA